MGPGPGARSLCARRGSRARRSIPFAFEKISVQPNTLEAHRLLHYAEQQGRQDEVAEELFKAYFVDGADLTDHRALADVARRRARSREATVRYLESDADRDLVAQADVEARTAGIGGVPFFIFNRRIGVSGAQDSATLLDAMEQARRNS